MTTQQNDSVKQDSQPILKKKAGRGRGRPSSEDVRFPAFPLKKCIEIATVISEKYGGQPTDPLDIASALNLKLNSDYFRSILSASHYYGITIGSYKALVVTLTDLGKKIVEPIDNETDSILIALLKPDLFSKILNTYNRQKIPRDGFLKNALKNNFRVPHDRVQKCADVLNANIKDYDLIHETGILNLKKHANIKTIVDDSTLEQTYENNKNVEVKSNTENKTTDNTDMLTRVFISHSKNMEILDQIKQTLTFGNFEYEIAVEEETTAIPIPDKIFGLMRKCNCTIINVSADEQEKHEDENYGINQNVLIEIGAAFLLYNKKVILLVDKRVDLPSNLQGLSVLQYEGNNLNWNIGMKLQEALLKFRQPSNVKSDTSAQNTNEQ